MPCERQAGQRSPSPGARAWEDAGGEGEEGALAGSSEKEGGEDFKPQRLQEHTGYRDHSRLYEIRPKSTSVTTPDTPHPSLGD